VAKPEQLRGSELVAKLLPERGVPGLARLSPRSESVRRQEPPDGFTSDTRHSWFFRLLHDLEMRRGLRPLPGYLQRMLNEPEARITLRLEQPRGLTETNHGGPPWAA
jgi:hypothetical protein